MDLLLEQLADLLAERVAARLGAAHRQGGQWIPMRAAGVPLRALRRAIRSGEVVARKVGRSVFVRRDAIEQWVAGQPAPQPPGETERERLLRLATAPKRGRAT
jgi:hypothetical protein